MIKRYKNHTKVGVVVASILIISLAILTCLLVFAPYFASSNSQKNIISANASNLESTSLGFVSRNQDSQNRASITFSYNDKYFKFVDEKINPPNHVVSDEIIMRKINSSLSEKLLLVERILHAGSDYKKAMTHCFPLLYKTIDRVVNTVNKPPVDSQIKFYPNQKPNFKISREQVGYEIDAESLFRDAYTHLRRNLTTPLVVRPKVIKPSVTAEDNAKLTNKRAGFSTSYANSSSDRKNNIELAMQKINGRVLQSGEEFSFNKAVGARTEANGFKSAKIIVGGEYVPGVGGGVCQASTTVYNAALLADMQITQVHNHSLLSSYVLPSFDAMVNSNSADLRFKNLCKYPVFIKAIADGQRVTVEFYGSKLGFKISTESITTLRTPPPPDKEEIDLDYKYFDASVAISGERKRIARGHGALRSEGYILYHCLNGNLLERKRVRKDSYKGLAGTVVIAP